MKRPFDFVDGQPVDLNNPEHVKVVRERNNILEKATRYGLDAESARIDVKITISLKCLKCGHDVHEKQVFDHIPSFLLLDGSIITCACCETSYRYQSLLHEFEVITNSPPPHK